MADNAFKKFTQDILKDYDKAEAKHEKKLDKKEKRIRDYRKEVSRKAAIANKRLQRLEKSEMFSPAYDKWLAEGGQKFSVKGKTYNEVQSELARINSYLDNVTSTISGAKKVVKEMAKNTGVDINWSDWKQVQAQSKAFFEIASKVEQYLRTVEDRASAVGYQKIWQAINQYVKESEKSLDVSADQIDAISADVIKAMKVWDEEITTKEGGYTIWQKLDKF